MKDRAAAAAAAAATTSAVNVNGTFSHRLLPSYHPLDGHQHHDHRLIKKSENGVDDDDRTVWRELKSRGAADANLLANSLSSRLRKGARQRAVASSGVASNSAASRYTVTSADEDEEGESDREPGKHISSSSHKRPSILKRTLSKEEVERNKQNLFSQLSPRADPSYDDYHLPNLHRHFPREDINDEIDRRKGHGKSGKNNAFSGGGGGGGGYSSSNGSQLVWVKRDGIFQPADKYATGRQTLHGDDQPYTHNQPVDYETVTLRSQVDSPDSAWGTTSGWSSGKSLRRKGLKVSWKTPAEGQGTVGEGRAGTASAGEVTTSTSTSASSSPFRQRSAGTVQSDMAYRFDKLKFNPGRSRVPLIGVRWKVQVPMAGRGGGGGGSGSGDGGGTDGGGSSASPCENSGHSSPTFSPHQPLLPKSQPLVPKQQQQQQQNGSVSSGSSSKPVSSRSWRAMLPRDVHPVTTAMEREGTSVTKTMWHVPATRKVPPVYTVMEGLLESRAHQWNPVALHHHAQNVLRGQRVGRYTTRATLDGQSFQHRVEEDAQDPAPSATATTTTTTTSIAGDSAITTGYGGWGEEYTGRELPGES